jgi:hypothetical protein
MCFVKAYDFSVVPGGDTIRLAGFVDCMNTDLARDVFEISTEPGTEAPVPFSDLPSDQANAQQSLFLADPRNTMLSASLGE